jgi:hypothetical protein
MMMSQCASDFGYQLARAIHLHGQFQFIFALAFFSTIARHLLLLFGFDSVFAVGRLAQWLARLVYTE